MTDRLTLRAYRDDDAEALFDLHSREEVQRWIGDGLVGTLLLKPIPISGSALAADPGTADLEHAIASLDVEIGWHLHPDVWGRGVATEAARRVLDHASDHGLEHVVAVTHPDNLPSQRVALRLGMVDRGSTERYYDTTTRLFDLDLSA